MSFDTLPTEVREKIRQIRKEQFAWGFGRPPVTDVSANRRLLLINGVTHAGPASNSFHQFLEYYVRTLFGPEWISNQRIKSERQQHPAMEWFEADEEFRRTIRDRKRRGVDVPASGVVAAVLSLAWDLFILQNNGILQDWLLQRLRHPDQFQGARYETYVTAAFVRAGFEVVLENENDPSRSHVEFSATHRESGRSFSVEAKSRHRDGVLGRAGSMPPLDQIRADFYNLLSNALQKEAEYDRIVFVDVNVPQPLRATFSDITRQLSSLESATPRGQSLPPALLGFTNWRHHYLGRGEPARGIEVSFVGFKIPEMKGESADEEYKLHEYLAENPAIAALFDRVTQQTHVPVDWPQWVSSKFAIE